MTETPGRGIQAEGNRWHSTRRWTSASWEAEPRTGGGEGADRGGHDRVRAGARPLVQARGLRPGRRADVQAAQLLLAHGGVGAAHLAARCGHAGRGPLHQDPDLLQRHVRGRRHHPLQRAFLALPRVGLPCQVRGRPGGGHHIEDWPISYDDMEPFYEKAEWTVGVSGQGWSSPFDPPRKRDYPVGPAARNSPGAALERGARKLGLHPFPTPLAILTGDYDGRPGASARACARPTAARWAPSRAPWNRCCPRPWPPDAWRSGPCVFRGRSPSTGRARLPASLISTPRERRSTSLRAWW